jgi:hypothetical protein
MVEFWLLLPNVQTELLGLGEEDFHTKQRIMYGN